MGESARIAYEAYRTYAHGVSMESGRALPPWEELAQTISDAWEAAVQAVEDALSGVPSA